MAAKSGLALLSLFFTAGGLLLLFFVLLAGTSDRRPLSLIYFLSADTSNIPGAPDQSRWTFWNLCSVTDNDRNDCGEVHAAFPLDPPSHRNFDTRVNVPHQFLGTNKYFLMTRFMFAFMLINMFFAACALFTGLLALCSRIGSYLSGFLNMICLFFLTITASLMSAAYVEGRDHFEDNGQDAKVGQYAFGFMWAGWACIFLSIVLFCLAGRGAQRKEKRTHKSTRTTRGFFRPFRSRSTRSRGSFVEGRIKDDYA